jgi:hypothetical protein
VSYKQSHRAIAAARRLGYGDRGGIGKRAVEDAIGAMLWLGVVGFCAALIADAFTR